MSGKGARVGGGSRSVRSNQRFFPASQLPTGRRGISRETLSYKQRWHFLTPQVWPCDEPRAGSCFFAVRWLFLSLKSSAYMIKGTPFPNFLQMFIKILEHYLINNKISLLDINKIKKLHCINFRIDTPSPCLVPLAPLRSNFPLLMIPTQHLPVIDPCRVGNILVLLRRRIAFFVVWKAVPWRAGHFHCLVNTAAIQYPFFYCSVIHGMRAYMVKGISSPGFMYILKILKHYFKNTFC